MVYKNYYKILDLETNHVSIDEIKVAYRQAAKKYHPDLNVGDSLAEEKIKDINEAYKVLSVPSSKRKYDRIWNSKFGKGTKAFSDKSQKGAIFSIFLGNIDNPEKEERIRINPVKGENIETEINVSIYDAFYGLDKQIALKTIDGKIPKIDGEFSLGFNVKLGYFDQQMEFENPEDTVFDEFYKKFPNLTTTQIRTILGSFLFTGEDVFKKINMLSGGEKGRLQLCEIFKKGPNLLLLDEPTNHMDIVGKETLENMLKEYKGTIIFVSHDRYFVNKIADCILEFEKGKVTFFDGNYEDYMHTKTLKYNQETSNIPKEVKQEKKTNNDYFINKENNKTKAKINKLEKEIAEKENKVKDLQKEMLKEEYSTDYVKLKEIQDEIQRLNQEIEEKMAEWMFLGTLL